MDFRLRAPDFGPAVVLLMLAAPAAAQEARLTGCVTDQLNTPLPGVAIFAQRDGRTLQSVTGDDGCYASRAMSPGSYMVLACLAGFSPVGRNDVMLTPGRVETLNFVLRVGPVAEEIYISRLGDLWKLADAVLRVRTTAYRFLTDSDVSASAIHEARIVTAWKSDSRLTNASVTFRQGLLGECHPYEPATDLVVFLRWDERQGDFERVGGRNGVFSVTAGQLTHAGIHSYDGKTVATLVAELDALRDKADGR